MPRVIITLLPLLMSNIRASVPSRDASVNFKYIIPSCLIQFAGLIKLKCYAARGYAILAPSPLDPLFLDFKAAGRNPVSSYITGLLSKDNQSIKYFNLNEAVMLPNSSSPFVEVLLGR